ncbi:MAG: excinuclease ABC subunit UvrC [Candidatus Omnitrophota bacterium]
MDIKEKIKSFPLCPGVYIMKSGKGEVLYVGKASSLKKRVKSYFSSRNLPKTEALMNNVAGIDCIECDSPQQALILEAALIKEKKPKYNVVLKDSKSYPYIEITDEDFPRIFISRPKQKNKSLFFGPYTEAKTLKSALTLIRGVFPFRSCRSMPKKPCLFFHLKLCSAPCTNSISLTAYKAGVKAIREILKGRRKELIISLRERMKKLSVQNNFEEAVQVRDKILAIESLYKGGIREHEIVSLKKVLNLSRLPLIIEAVDISSLGENQAVGSIVTFKAGVADKNNYRRFLIKETSGIDDYAMIAEVVRRRYSRLIKENKKIPDLLIVDGGKGHAVRVQNELKNLGVSLTVIGIAKRNEEIWLPLKNKPLIISKDSSSLHLIQRARDEAHRFAHSYLLSRRGIVRKK